MTATRSACLVAIFALLLASGSNSAARSELLDPAKICKDETTTVINKQKIKIDAKEVCTLLVVVRNTLNQLKDKVPKTPRLTSVTLNLKAETASQRGGEITIFVVKFGAKSKAETVQTLDIKFPIGEGAPESLGDPVPFSTSLANSIAASFKAIETSGIGLQPGALTTSVRFGVTRGASGGGSISITPITVSVSGGVDTGTTQELAFKFGEEKK